MWYALQMRIAGKKKVLKLIGAVRCTIAAGWRYTRTCACCVERLEVISTSTNLNVYTPHCVCGLVRACVRNINSLANEPSIFFLLKWTYFLLEFFLALRSVVYTYNTSYAENRSIMHYWNAPGKSFLVYVHWEMETMKYLLTLCGDGGNFGCRGKSVGWLHACTL